MDSLKQSRVKAIRSLIDVIEHIPPEVYGKTKARILRRLVHIVMAKFANADGTHVYASLSTIAYLCLVSERAVQDVVKWLVENGLLKYQGKALFVQTNEYDLIFPTQEEMRDVVASRRRYIEEQREKTRRRVRNWRDRQQSSQGDGAAVTELGVTEQSPTCDGDDPAVTVTERLTTVAEGSLAVTAELSPCNGNGSSVDRPSDRLYRDNRPTTPSASPSSAVVHEPASATGVGDDVVYDALDKSTAPPLPVSETRYHPAIQTSHKLDRLHFMGEVQKIWQRHVQSYLHTFAANAAHADAAFTLANEYGQSLFLIAWENWLLKGFGDLLVIIGKEEDPKTGRVLDRKKWRAWPLHYFINSGAAIAQMELVRPYCQLVRGRVLAFVLQVKEEVGLKSFDMTSDQVSKLSSLLEQHGPEALVDLFETYACEADNPTMGKFIDDYAEQRLAEESDGKEP